MQRVVATAALAAALALSLVACASSQADDDPEAGPGDVVGQESHERAVGARLVDGRVPLDLALDLFAAAFGPIDGGNPDVTGPAGPSGTGALFGVLAHWDALSDDQRAAVEAAIGPVGSTPPDDGAAGALEVRTVALTETAEPVEGITALIAEVRADFERRTGHTMSVPIVPSTSDAPLDPTMAAATGPMRGGAFVTGGRMDACGMEFYPDAWDAIGTPLWRYLVAHEVWHCMQLDAAPNVVDVISGARWVIEGQAEFASFTIAPNDKEWPWAIWLGEPEIGLLEREYTALGLYAVAEQSGADVWHRMLDMLGEPDRDGLELLFGSPAEDAMTAVARALVREPPLGVAWESTGPGITAKRGATLIDAPPGMVETRDFKIVPYASAPIAIAFSGEVLDVEVHGAIGMIGLPGGLTAPVATDFTARYCVAGFCACPDGGDVRGTEIPSAGVVGLGLTTTGVPPVPTAAVDVRMTITVRTVAEACENLPPAPIMIVRFHAPEEFEVHGGHCLVQDNGHLLIQAGDNRLPEGYAAPDSHRDDVALGMYVDPAAPPDHGSFYLTIGGVDYDGGSRIIVSPDRLSGTFSTDKGFAGEWVCPELIPAREFSGTP